MGTQLLHAAGGAYARTVPPNPPLRRGTAAYFGDGGSSTADFAAAANLAATHPSPLLLLSRNNGWAISTPVSSQWACDRVAGRAGGGYGVAADHSTSDDASRYRDAPRLAAAAAAADPVTRLRGALAAAGWWGGARDADVDDYAREQRAAVAAAVAAAEAAAPPPAASLFEDVYDVPPPRLAGQRRELLGHLRRHPTTYAGVPVE